MAGTRNSLRTIRKISEISQEFETGKFDLHTVARLISVIADSYRALSGEQLESLLQIPLDLLEHDVELTDPMHWSTQRAHNFAADILVDQCGQDAIHEGKMAEMRKKFESGCFNLSDVWDLTSYVQENHDKLGIAVESALRIIEYTFLYDDIACREHSKYMCSGRAFAIHINKTMGL